MSTLVNLAILGLAGASMVAADAPLPADSEGCVPLTDAVSSAGLTSLSAAVASLLGADGAEDLAFLLSPIALDDELKFTLFAPEDAAWPAESELPTGNALLEVLLGHVGDMYLPSTAVVEALAAAEEVPLLTLAGTEIIATMEGEDIFLAAEMQAPPGAQVIQTDIETCTGVIHIIDALLIGDAALAPGPASLAPLIAPLEAPLMAPLAVGPDGEFIPSPLAPPGVAPGPEEALAPGLETGGEDSATRDAGDLGTVASDDTDGASHLIAGTVCSVAAAALALLA